MPNFEITVRQATYEDAAELARLRWDFSPDEVQSSGQPFASFASQFAEFLANALEHVTWTIWVAECDGKLAGNVYVQAIAKVPHPGRFGRQFGYITNVYVEPSMRGAGIGSRMLQMARAWAREQKLESMFLWAVQTAIPFYERNGFTRSGDAMELEL